MPGGKGRWTRKKRNTQIAWKEKNAELIHSMRLKSGETSEKGSGKFFEWELFADDFLKCQLSER